uniref:Uncharacterized protein n=1 Tax=Ditylum brightwellii TaxID=49249 RepID=A0A6V2JR99_9STRA
MHNFFAVVFLPLVYLHASMSLPCVNTFDVKNELMHVLRGDYVPEHVAQKPKTFVGKFINDACANIATTKATLPGYEVTFMNILNACIITKVRVPAKKLDYYWIGHGFKWIYVGSSYITSEQLKGY